MNKFWQYYLFFVVCVLAQVLLFDNIPLWGFVQPYPYLLFILVLPTNITRPWLYVLAFLLGLTIDLFASTLCLHAAATTFMAFLRQPLIVLTTSHARLFMDLTLHTPTRFSPSPPDALSCTNSCFCHPMVNPPARCSKHCCHGECYSYHRILYLCAERKRKGLSCRQARRWVYRSTGVCSYFRYLSLYY